MHLCQIQILEKYYNFNVIFLNFLGKLGLRVKKNFEAKKGLKTKKLGADMPCSPTFLKERAHIICTFVRFCKCCKSDLLNSMGFPMETVKVFFGIPMPRWVATVDRPPRGATRMRFCNNFFFAHLQKRNGQINIFSFFLI